jgi:hypothetical protein
MWKNFDCGPFFEKAFKLLSYLVGASKGKLKEGSQLRPSNLNSVGVKKCKRRYLIRMFKLKMGSCECVVVNLRERVLVSEKE